MAIGEQVARAFWFAVVCGIGMLVWHYMTESSHGNTQPRWRTWRDAFMSRYTIQADDQADEREDNQADENEVERNDESAESSDAMPKVARSAEFQFPDVFEALAALVLDNKLSEMEALRFGLGVSPGGSRKYKEARQTLTEAINAKRPSNYRPLTQEQIDKRQELGLPINK